jgi:hypothetical protein
MSENTTLPTGEVVAADDVGGVKFQRVKLVHGADGVNDGDVAEGNGLPVEVQGVVSARAAGRDNWRVGFAKTLANADPEYFETICVGSGMSVSQTGGNLVLTSGTTIGAETILRSVQSLSGAFRLLWHAVLSQRIVNQSFFVELVDVIGDGLAYIINSATQVTVTFPAGQNPFTAANVGQSMTLGAISDINAVPGRYAIAAVAGDEVSFTVAAWPSSGTGTLSLFGWNYHRVEYQGVTATQAAYDCQRKGWATGNTTATITTTATGHIATMLVDDGVAGLADQTVASFTANAITHRAGRVLNVPDLSTVLRLQIRVLNGAVAPASTTTLTVGFVSASSFSPASVSLESIRPSSPQQSLPVAAQGTTITQGAGGAGAAISGNPFRLGARALTANYAAVTNGQTADLVATLVGALIQKPYAIPEQDWSYAAASGGIVNTSDVPIKGAAAAGIRNYLTALTLSNPSATATEVVVKDGASTVIWRGHCPANAPAFAVPLPSPLRGTAATALNVACITTGAAVYVNAQGYTAP